MAPTTEAPILRYYDPTCQLEVQCDASRKGLGAALMQRGQPITYISQALTLREQRYAQINKECPHCLCSWAIPSVHICWNVLVYSDRKPLESILRKPLASAPRRVQDTDASTKVWRHSTTNVVRICSLPTCFQEHIFQRSQRRKTESSNMSKWLVVSLSPIQDWKKSDSKIRLMRQCKF